MTPRERFMAKVAVQSNGCWLWTGGIDPTGYGRFYLYPRVVYAHRAAYELFVGPIPTGLDIDHQCHNEDDGCGGGPTCPHRRCVNPAHMEPSTRAANLARSDRSGRRARRLALAATALEQRQPKAATA